MHSKTVMKVILFLALIDNLRLLIELQSNPMLWIIEFFKRMGKLLRMMISLFLNKKEYKIIQIKDILQKGNYKMLENMNSSIMKWANMSNLRKFVNQSKK